MSHEITPRSALSDRAVSYLRTTVPVAWGSLVGLLLQLVSPHLPADVVAALADWLSGPAAAALVTAAAIAAWYWAWRRLEPHVPDWLVRIVLGSAATPTYAPVVDGAAQITTLSPDERTNLGSLAIALEPGDPGRTALERILTE